MTEAHQTSDRHSVRAASLVAGGIFVSRIIGFVRDRVFAHFFGNSAEADAYATAIKIPNILRNLLGEGALSASFIPVYSAVLDKSGGDAKAARTLANTVLALLLVATSLLTIAGILLAPVITAVVATGFTDPERSLLTTKLIRVLFPMTGIMVLSGWCLGVQNSHRLFFNAYASAALWSVAQIVLLVAWGPQADSLATLAWWLSWATLAGSLLQLAAQLPQVIPLVRPIRLRLDLSAEGVRETLRNFLPVVTALGLFQVSSLIDVQIASWLPTGSIAALGYATRLYMVPLALFGTSIAAASLPEFSRESAAISHEALLERLRAGWLRILFYIIPTTVAFVAYGDLIVGLIYKSGRFGTEEQQLVHWILAAYAVGLVSFSSVKLVASAFYAMQDYRTPLRAALWSIIASAAGGITVALAARQYALAAAGLALATAAGSYLNLFWLTRGLRQRLGALYTSTMRAATLRIAGATLIAAVAAIPVRWLLHDQNVIVTAAGTLPVFAIIFLVAAHHWGINEAGRWLRRIGLPRRGGGGEGK
ncbi:MAG: murein biosynthesis integral membrane protein MurJ [Gemmatimonadaceae bacterium]